MPARVRTYSRLTKQALGPAASMRSSGTSMIFAEKERVFWLIESANRLLFEVIRGLRLKLVLRTSKLSGQSVDETRLCFLPFQLLFSRSYTTAWSYESAAKHARRLHPTSTLVLATVEGRPDAVTNHRARISFRWL